MQTGAFNVASLTPPSKCLSLLLKLQWNRKTGAIRREAWSKNASSIRKEAKGAGVQDYKCAVLSPSLLNTPNKAFPLDNYIFLNGQFSKRMFVLAGKVPTNK